MDKNTRCQGARAVAKAVSHYADLGYPVFIPVSGDITRYDLVIDCPERGLLRVEVKSTNREIGEIALRTKGGNKSGAGTIRRLSADDCDMVFCVNLCSGSVCEFPIHDLVGRTTVRVL